MARICTEDKRRFRRLVKRTKSSKITEKKFISRCKHSRGKTHYPPKTANPQKSVHGVGLRASSSTASEVLDGPPRSASRLLFSSKRSLRSARILYCRFSTPSNQYPKPPPIDAKRGYAQRPSLWKKGLISMPSCHSRTATPVDQLY